MAVDIIARTLVSKINSKDSSAVYYTGNNEEYLGSVANLYKHIIHVKFTGDSTNEYQNNDVYFTLVNHSPDEVTSFSQLMGSFDLYESIVVYNSSTNATNMFMTKVTEDAASYTETGSDPVILGDDNVTVLGDNHKKITDD